MYDDDYDGDNYENDDFENDGISDDYNFTVPALSVRLVFPYFMMISFYVSASDYEDNDDNKKDGTGKDDVENNTNYTVNWG